MKHPGFHVIAVLLGVLGVNATLLSRSRHVKEDVPNASPMAASEPSQQENERKVEAELSYIRAKVMKHVHGRRKWSSSSLPEADKFPGTVFYPFGGVDALSAIPIFANARSIVIAALHRAGDCEEYSHWSKVPTTAMIKLVQHSFLRYGGYFGTDDMFENLDESGYGATPFLLATLYLMGEKVTSVECGADIGPGGNSLGLAAGKAVRIRYECQRSMECYNQSGVSKELIYVQADLLTPSPTLDGILGAMHKQAPLFTMMKAAGYILRHRRDNTVNLRKGYRLNAHPLEQMILRDSQAILQDDTGLRVSCMDGWDFTFFGEYVGPARLNDVKSNFTTDYDDSLHAIWCNSAKEKKHDLPVRFGYRIFNRVGACPMRLPYDKSCSAVSSVPPVKKVAPFIKFTMGFAMLVTKKKAE